MDIINRLGIDTNKSKNSKITVNKFISLALSLNDSPLAFTLLSIISFIEFVNNKFSNPILKDLSLI